MFVEKFIQGYLVSIGDSIFTNRKGKLDVSFSLPDTWGARHKNGRLYTTRLRLAAETRESIGSQSDPVPQAVIDEAFALLS